MTREMNTPSPATNAVNNIGMNLSKTMNAQPILKAANNALNSAANVATNAANSAANLATNAANTLAKTANNVTAPLSNGLKNIGANLDKVNTSIQNTFNSVGDNIRENVSNAVNNTAKAMNLGNLNSKNANLNLLFGNGAAANANRNMGNVGQAAAETGISSLAALIGIFLALVLVFVLLFYYFASEIKDGYDKLFTAIRSSLGLEVSASAPSSEESPAPDALFPPPSTPEVPTEMSQNILEKVLPLGRTPEVFNVSKNEFTYYDAEPLCRALGAELATYEQVKDAYEKGADWCNYGWVKGQVAIYPTQKATWDQLQGGPDDQKEACGRPGVNGGFFDNPEMRFGVNCYGPKPPQSAHDEAELMKQGRIPRTTSSLKVDEKINEYKRMADSLGVMPFNKDKWGTA